MGGSFNALIKASNFDWPDGQPEVTTVEFTVTEVAE